MNKKLLLWGLSLIILVSLITSCNAISSLGSSNIATVTQMNVEIRGFGIYDKDGLYVQLKPTNAKADVNYAAMLYEKGKDLNEGCGVMWNQPEINVGTIKTVYFPLSQEEILAYQLQSNPDWWKSIFSIKIVQ